MDMCRDRHGDFQQGMFNLWTCAMCYHYLFQNKKDLKLSGHVLVAVNSSILQEGETIYPDIQNGSVVRKVCETLDSYDCNRWRMCCQSAVSCCRKQLGEPPRVTTSTSDFCPQTWDGFSCVESTSKDTTVYITCPSYIDHRAASGKAEKVCDENGTWWKEPDSGLEWTDYTKCVNLQGFKTLHKVAVACNAMSLALLVPACFILSWFRFLKRQYRVRIHLNLFVSLILRNIVVVLWENLVYNDRLENLNKPTLMHQNTVGCKMLYVLTRYSLSVNFAWMFLEGFHLNRLIVRVFKVPKTILPYYLAGWLVPWLPVIIYSYVRIQRQDQGCWVQNIEAFEWILYAPNLVCILINVCFLCGILRILLTQLQIHPQEPSNYRKALKASFVLVPLFGLQLFLVIYRPLPESYQSYIFEMVATVITNSQGTIVAILLCYSNHEVYLVLKSKVSIFKKTSACHRDIGRTFTKTKDRLEINDPLNCTTTNNTNQNSHRTIDIQELRPLHQNKT